MWTLGVRMLVKKYTSPLNCLGLSNMVLVIQIFFNRSIKQSSNQPGAPGHPQPHEFNTEGVALLASKHNFFRPPDRGWVGGS